MVTGNQKCLDGWEYRKSSNKCYKYFEIIHDHSTASQHCQDLCGHLAMPFTAKENDDVRHLYTFKHTWIGLTRSEIKQPFRWADGRNLRWNNWDKKQPDGPGLCVILTKTLTWRVVECSEQYSYVCEMSLMKPNTYCNVESAPSNGQRSTDKKNVPMGIVVNYSCNKDYVIEFGRSDRMCCGDKKLSGSTVTCIRDCPKGWTYSMPSKQCYRLSDKQENYNTATSKCNELGGTLALPRSEEENGQLMEYDVDLWIGIHYRKDEKIFLWADDEPIVWKNFFRHALKDRHKKGDCVIHQHRHGNSLFKGTWILNKCSEKRNYVCQVSVYKLNEGRPGTAKCNVEDLPPHVSSSRNVKSINVGETITYSCAHGFHIISGNRKRRCQKDGRLDGRMIECNECPKGWIMSKITNKCYRFYEESVLYIASTEKCRNLGGTMAMPKDANKNEIISAAAGSNRVWIGLSDGGKEKLFEWEDGELMTWTNWFKGGPKNDDGRDCVSMRYDGKWIVDPCHKKFYYMCKIPTKQHSPECEVPLNPNVKTLNAEDSSVTLGFVVEFSCADSYTAVSGDTKRECLGNGQLDGQPLVCAKGCPDGWTQSGSDKCFRFYPERLEYSKARETCEIQNAKLAMPQNKDKSEQVMRARVARAKIWIGLDDIQKEGRYTWADGSVLKDGDWKNWRPNEPDNYQGGEDCVVMAKSGEWTDNKCSNRNNFICEQSSENSASGCKVEAPLNGVKSAPGDTVSVGTKVQFSCNKCFVAESGDESRECLINGMLSGEPLVCKKTCPKGWTTMESKGQCYRLFKKAATYTDAQAECWKEKGSLALPKSEAEYNKLLEARTSGGRVWIGLNDIGDEGNFKWDDGTRLGWKNWNPGQPDNGRDNEHCVHMISSGKWEDNNCQRRYWFLCQLPLATITEECKA